MSVSVLVVAFVKRQDWGESPPVADVINEFYNRIGIQPILK